MIVATDTLALYANDPKTRGDDFLAVFRWLLIDRKTRLADHVQPVAEIIAGDQDELTANRAAKCARLRKYLKRCECETKNRRKRKAGARI